MTEQEYQQVRQKIDQFESLRSSQERIQETLEKMKNISKLSVRFDFVNSDTYTYSWAYIPDRDLFLETLRNYLEFKLTMIQHGMAELSMFGEEKTQNP